MPVPGQPRNPDGEVMLRFRRVEHAPVVDAGRTPGTMQHTTRGCVLAAGQIRRFYRQAVNYVAPAMPFSWSHNAPGPGRPEFAQPGVQGVTRALRYMTRSEYVQAGTDNTRLSELHTVVRPKVRSKRTSIGVGQRRARPTVRNRMTSFGSRVEPLNKPVPGAEGGSGGGGDDDA